MHPYILPSVLGLVLLALLVVLHFRFARYRAIRDHKKEVSFFGGYVRLLLWEPSEGLVILRDKKISAVIPDGDVDLSKQGGVRYVSAFRGEELRARLPLTLRMVTWEDENILTRESIRARMKVALWWRIKNLSQYVFTINSGVHVDGEHKDVGLLEAAELWLQTMTESTMRTLASQASIAVLISSKATAYLRVATRDDIDVDTDKVKLPETGSPEAIAINLCRDVAAKVKDYGIELQRVEIQEVSLSKEIQEAIDKVWRASLLPAQSEQEAKARQIQLQAVANVIGVDATAMTEILKNLNGTSFYGIPPFLEAMFQRLTPQSPVQRPALPDKSAPPPLPLAEPSKQ
jgi:regulator of protease activity HflC (stomatin/prohibitin superfamily)